VAILTILAVENLVKNFGGVLAVNEVSFEVNEKEVLGLIGPNGSGKTTVFNLVTGAIKPDSGNVRFEERKITGMKPHETLRLGVARTFQIVRPFLGETVLKNLMVGPLFGRNGVNSMKEAEESARRMLSIFNLGDRSETLVRNLTTNDRKRVELAKCIASRPKLLLLDEFMAGLMPTEIRETIELIKKVKNEMGFAMIMVEHLVWAVMDISDRIVVLDHGKKIFEGTPAETARSREVIEAYLGVGYNPESS
jgi:branched-chain amino acid transport system ATP-binding protein